MLPPWIGYQISGRYFDPTMIHKQQKLFLHFYLPQPWPQKPLKVHIKIFCLQYWIMQGIKLNLEWEILILIILSLFYMRLSPLFTCSIFAQKILCWVMVCESVVSRCGGGHNLVSMRYDRDFYFNQQTHNHKLD